MAAPITIDRFVEELEKLHGEMLNGNLKHGEYDQRLAATIRELRERGIDADRDATKTALAGAHDRGIITDAVHTHLTKRLGLV